ncbi:Solute carrier family 49 member 4-like 3 [Homarus americanus]|uniref:Solute carrier family 49 member 4-like 3 n=1 Tax=Homarus americanus TaxID=6706 RepID=A0A8J5N7T3_HOMAM|nr:Solute carrier family 49 member 4-like 3 [Homarus americanus]
MSTDCSSNSNCTESTRLLPGEDDKRCPSYHGGEGDDREVLQPAHVTTTTRFWILAVFCVLSWVQGVQWNTWGPISESMGAAFPGWGASTVAMMANWGTIMFVVFVFPMSWATQRYSLRAGVVASAALIFVGTSLRCFTRTVPTFTILCHVCAVLVGVASTFVLSAPPLVASHWFPPQERTTALALMFGASQLSGVGSYLEPLLVRLPTPHASILDIQEDVMLVLYIGAGVSGALLVAVIIYFPSKPPTPPSFTSATARLEFFTSFSALAKNGRWLVLVVTYGVVVGPSIAWGSVLNYSLLPLGLHQDEAMWVAQTAMIVSSISPVVSGRFTDLFHGHVYASVVGGTAFNYATIPLFYEMGVDLAYPAPEILVSGAITAADNLISIFFFLVFFIPNVGYQWMTYTLVFSTSVSILPLLLIRFRYTRSTIDAQQV